ncbi:MAG: hypothetical protein JJT96_15305 [Opitutales bacterium]|nr:hypothetical protein [Opitutales bacterium]
MENRSPLFASTALWASDCPRTEVYALFCAVEELTDGVGPCPVWISASQRFRFWLDGVLLAEGPSRADPHQWGYLQVNLPARTSGKHLFAVEVVHWGRAAGKGQIGPPGFFLFSGIKLQWRARRDPSRFPHRESKTFPLAGHRQIGPGEAFVARDHPWGWQDDPEVSADWPPAEPFGEVPGNPWGNRPLDCSFVPEPLPPMIRTPWSWSRQPDAARVPAHSNRSLLFDAGVVLNAYPVVAWSGGAGASVHLIWSEAPVQQDGKKGNRDQTDGCSFPGQADLLSPDGASGRVWTPPWIRSFRYVHVRIQTGEQPLHGLEISLERSSFPLRPTLEVKFDDPSGRPWKKLRQISIDTTLACSHETFFDCPAWEQAQFPGDARIQARHHYLLANEDRLARKAIRDLSAFRMPDGLILSHAPSSFRQVIATYGLQWIGLLSDFRIYRGDSAFIRPHLPCARGILEWFLSRRRSDGLPGFIPEPLFVDWTPSFSAGCAPQDDGGGSLLLAAMLAEACSSMAQLEAFAGRTGWVSEWEAEAASLRTAIRRIPAGTDGLLPDTAGGTSYSVHTQVQAVLAGVWTSAEGLVRLRKALNDSGVIQPATLYYRSYLAEAFRRCGDGAGVWQLLPKWFRLLENTGLTTWPESDRMARSDCHGWGVMPEIEIVHTLLGLRPDPARSRWACPQFDPCLGDLVAIGGRVPHPAGFLDVDMRRTDRGIAVDLRSPVEIHLVSTGERLLPGHHQFVVSEGEGDG